MWMFGVCERLPMMWQLCACEKSTHENATIHFTNVYFFFLRFFRLPFFILIPVLFMCLCLCECGLCANVCTRRLYVQIQETRRFDEREHGSCTQFACSHSAFSTRRCFCCRCCSARGRHTKKNSTEAQSKSRNEEFSKSRQTKQNDKTKWKLCAHKIKWWKKRTNERTKNKKKQLKENGKLVNEHEKEEAKGNRTQNGEDCLDAMHETRQKNTEKKTTTHTRKNEEKNERQQRKESSLRTASKTRQRWRQLHGNAVVHQELESNNRTIEIKHTKKTIEKCANANSIENVA